MKNNLFDSYVKEQLGSYRPDVPSHIWENIAAQSSSRKPVGFWGSISGTKGVAAILILIATLGSLVYLLTPDNSPAGNTSAVEKNSIIDKKPPSGNISSDYNSSSAGNVTGNVTPDLSNEKYNGLSVLPDAVTTHKIKALSPGIFSYTDPDVSGQFDAEQHTNKEKKPDHSLFPSDQFFALLRSGSVFNPNLIMPMLPASRDIPCPEQDAAGNKKYIEVYAGPDYAFRSYSDTANSAYMQQRKASTRLLYAYSAGVRYTRVFGSGMSVRTGINYSRVNESFKSVKGHVTQNVYITNNNGDTIGTSTVTGTLYKQSTNKYSSVDIPVTVGYELGNGRLHANVNAGAVINVYSKQTGFVLDRNGDAVDVSSGKTASAYKYKTNAGIGLTGGISVYYKLNDKFHVLAEPYIRYSLSPVTRPDLTLKEKHHTAGLRLGLRMDLK